MTTETFENMPEARAATLLYRILYFCTDKRLSRQEFDHILESQADPMLNRAISEIADAMRDHTAKETQRLTKQFEADLALTEKLALEGERQAVADAICQQAHQNRELCRY